MTTRMDTPITRMETPTTTRLAQEAGPTRRVRFGLLAKIIAFLAAILVPLAAVTWYVSVQAIQRSMTAEFTDKGSAIANSLASSGVDLVLTRDASTVQALVD
ncbi:MAG TPA: hypothetical protein VGX21_23455, partial [Methylomirabilota bacterium]|nr:hypothetical protein [Methylomirabilota bacterium]